jgi:hypothetical protein
MEIHDDTEALRQFMLQADPDNDEVESIHRAEVDPASALTLMANPKAVLKAMGVPVSDASEVQITMKNRADRTMAGASALGTQAAAVARLRRIIIIVIHYRNCDSDIFIFASR